MLPLFAYSTNDLIDTYNVIILNVEASRSIRQAAVGATRAMIERARGRFDLQPERLAADTAYGSAEMLGLARRTRITQHIPAFDIDKTERADGASQTPSSPSILKPTNTHCRGTASWREIGKE